MGALIKKLSRRTRIVIILAFLVLSSIFLLLGVIYRNSYLRVISILVFLPAIPLIIARDKEPYRSSGDYFGRSSQWSRKHSFIFTILVTALVFLLVLIGNWHKALELWPFWIMLFIFLLIIANISKKYNRKHDL